MLSADQHLLMYDDLKTADERGIELPIIFRLSGRSPKAHEIYNDLHKDALRLAIAPGTTPDDTVTEIVDVDEGIRLITAHLGNSGRKHIAFINQKCSKALPGFRPYVVLLVLREGCRLHAGAIEEPWEITLLNEIQNDEFKAEMERIKQGKDKIAIYCDGARFKMDNDPLYIALSMESAVKDFTKTHPSAARSLICKYLRLLRREPQLVAMVLYKLREADPIGEQLVRQVLRDEPEFHDLEEQIARGFQLP